MKLKDRVAIVTGAAKGIGWGIAKIFIQDGASRCCGLGMKKWRETARELCESGGDAIFQV